MDLSLCLLTAMPSMTPLVSVIVPVYNQQDTVGRALDSILSQRAEFDYEVIVGDDASRDCTLKVCRSCERRHPNVRVVANGRNLGLAANYYNLARLAAGKYIADLAGDDMWCHPDKLQMQAAAMEQDSRITLCHTDWEKVHASDGRIEASNPDGMLDAYRQPLASGRSMLLPIISHHPGPIIHSCTMIYRSDALNEAMRRWPQLFDAPDLVCEDLQLITSLAALGDIAYLPHVTLRYTVSEQSITGTHDYANLCRFYAGSLRLTRRLQRIHGFSDAEMMPCYRRMVPHIVDLAYRTLNPRLMRLATDAAKGLPLPMSSRIKRLAASLLTKKWT